MSKMEMFFWGWPKKSLNECFLKLLGRGCLVFLNQHWDFIPIKMGGARKIFHGILELGGGKLRILPRSFFSDDF